MREAWIRGSDDFWDDLETSQRGRFGSAFHSKRAYLAAVDRLLEAASGFPTLVVFWEDSSWLTGAEALEAVGRHRRVRVVYSKDFSEVPSGGRTSAIVTDG